MWVNLTAVCTLDTFTPCEFNASTSLVIYEKVRFTFWVYLQQDNRHLNRESGDNNVKVGKTFPLGSKVGNTVVKITFTHFSAFTSALSVSFTRRCPLHLYLHVPHAASWSRWSRRCCCSVSEEGKEGETAGGGEGGRAGGERLLLLGYDTLRKIKRWITPPSSACSCLYPLTLLTHTFLLLLIAQFNLVTSQVHRKVGQEKKLLRLQRYQRKHVDLLANKIK